MFNTRGEREDSLSRSAMEMIAAFEALLAFLVQPAASAVRCGRASRPFTELLSSFILCANARDTAEKGEVLNVLHHPAPLRWLFMLGVGEGHAWGGARLQAFRWLLRGVRGTVCTCCCLSCSPTIPPKPITSSYCNDNPGKWGFVIWARSSYLSRPFWLRSSVVSVLISLIADSTIIDGVTIKCIFLGGRAAWGSLLPRPTSLVVTLHYSHDRATHNQSHSPHPHHTTPTPPITPPPTPTRHYHYITALTHSATE